MNTQQLVTAEVMPDGTVKEVNPHGKEQPKYDVSKSDGSAYKFIEWQQAEQNRKVWPVENFTNKNGDWYLVSGQHVTGYISDGKFVITDINH